MELIENLREQRDALLAEAKALVEKPEATVEDLDVAERKTDEIAELDGRIAAAEKIEARVAEAAEAREAAGLPAAVPAVAVKREERTYRPDGASFFADAFASQHGDYAAADRLRRHATEESYESRAIGTGTLTGLVVPQYLVSQFAPLARAGQPTVEIANKSVPLPPEGMTLNISRATTGSSTAIQATQNSGVSETNIAETLLSVPVVTIAGQQNVSRQLLERGTPGLDALIFQDLVAAHAVTKDQQILSGSGSSGQALGILGTSGIGSAAFTSTSPTAALFYNSVANAAQTIASNRYLPADTIIMHPRRWGWLMAQADTSGRPLVTPIANGPYNAQAVGEQGYGVVVGTMQGLNVVTDANLPTTWKSGASDTTGTEDVAIVCRAADLMVFDDGDGMPRELRFEQTSGTNLTVALVAYSYTAMTAGRYPAAFAKVAGTGMVNPW